MLLSPTLTIINTLGVTGEAGPVGTVPRSPVTACPALSRHWRGLGSYTRPRGLGSHAVNHNNVSTVHGALAVTGRVMSTL